MDILNKKDPNKPLRNVTIVYQNQSDEVNQTNQQEEIDDPFQRELQREIKQDSLHPLDEFHVTEITKEQAEQTTALLTKSKQGLFNSFYEKKYGKKSVFIVLCFVVIGVFVFHNLSSKEIQREYNKDCFYFGNKEYMLKNY